MPIWPKRTAFAFLLLSVSLWALPASAQITGRYEPIGELPAPHSKSAVSIEEYISFSCPHCNNFHWSSKDFKGKYKGRLKITVRPIIFPGHTDAPARLYFIALKNGKGDKAMDLLFDTAFNQGVDIDDRATINYLARTLGLGEEIKKDYNANWVSQSVSEANYRAMQYGVDSTPTLIVEGTLRLKPEAGMDAFIGNLRQVVDSLLK